MDHFYKKITGPLIGIPMWNSKTKLTILELGIRESSYLICHNVTQSDKA